MTNKSWFYSSLILLQALIYGFGNVVTKVMYESITPFWSMVIRFAIAALIFMMFSSKHIFTELKRVKIRDWLPAAFCMSASFVCCCIALDMTSATNVGFLISLPVVFTPFFAAAVLHQRYRLINLPVQLAIIAGLYMLCSNSGAFVFGWGDAVSLLAAILGAAAFVFSEKSLKSVDGVTISAAQTGIGLLMTLPIAIFTERDFHISQVEPSAWLVILYLAVLCTVVAFRLQNLALSRISAQTVAIALCAEPIFTAIISRFVLGEVLSTIGLAGAAIIMVCIVIGNLICGAPKDTETPEDGADLTENEELAS